MAIYRSLDNDNSQIKQNESKQSHTRIQRFNVENPST